MFRSCPHNAVVRAQLAALVALAWLAAAPAWAARVVHVYEIDLRGDTPAALQQALREALVRATGRRSAATDPALAPLVADASHYVESYGEGPRGEAQVTFDAPALERAIAAAGLGVWPRERPYTLIVLDPPRARAAQEAARVELERAAQERGLPVTLVPLTLVDASGSPQPREALLAAAQRYGADEILIGRGESAAADATMQWSLVGRGQGANWSGPLSGAIDHTVDLLAPQSGTALAQPESEARVEIVGVATLDAYAAVERLLGATPGVRRPSLLAASGDHVIFAVMVRGGAAGLAQALGGVPRLTRAGGSAATPVYRYQPQG